ncbi:MAG TPA: ferrous iron transport protein B [Planctomycetota bacterium]|nr:ferrous iron transport protein B [Planctomycetota bacterium]
MSSPPEARPAARTLCVALAGNPNSGKTSIFNGLTGLRHRVANYPGVTVERIEAEMTLPQGRAQLVDLPGCYSLHARAEDERIARDVLLGLQPGSPRPDVILAVVDASNLERNLFFLTQLMETGMPVCIALNMVDVAERSGVPVDAPALEEALGLPVVPVVGRTGRNFPALREAVGRARRAAGRTWRFPAAGEEALALVRDAVARAAIVPPEAVEGEAVRLFVDAEDDDPSFARGGAALREAVQAARAQLAAAGIDREAAEAECRYALSNDIARRVRRVDPSPGPSRSERLDRIVTHRILGPLIYLAIMGIIFQAVYAWAEPFMGWIEAGTDWLGGAVAGLLGPGVLTDLLVDGAIAGAGNILVFLPQICLLFLFLTILDDVGYLSRAAFLVDRVMRGVGLHGKAFIPLMSSFACAIPGIMATRTIESRRDRMVTILVAPLMSCSARLPVYALMIGAFIPHRWQSITLLSMYALSVTIALLAALVLRKTIFRGEASTFILELPRYKVPSPRDVLRTVFDRGAVFVKQAGTVILAMSVVLWFLAYFPRSEEVKQRAESRIAAGEPKEEVRAEEAGDQVRQSFAGRLGHVIEPAIEPLGFDWKIGIGIISSFAARETLVSALGVVYGVGDVDETSRALRDQLREAEGPGGRRFTWLTAVSLMVFFVLACQCMSTLAVVKRETNSWRWPLFMFGYMTVLAYFGSLLVYQGGLALGFR